MLGKGVWEGQQESQLSGGLPCRVCKTPEVTLRLVVASKCCTCKCSAALDVRERASAKDQTAEQLRAAPSDDCHSEQCGSSLPPSLNSITHKSTVLISKGGADCSLGGPEAGVMEVGFSRGLCSSRALLRRVCNILR